MADKKYQKLVANMLNKIQKGKPMNESRIRYDEQHIERMLPKLEQELRERKHSLGDHPIFPESDEMHFEEKIMAERFTDIVREVKRTFNVNEIDNTDIQMTMAPMVMECMKIEKANKSQLQEMAIRMIRDEYNIPEDMVDIEAELTEDISLEGTKLNATPQTVEEADFDSHNDIQRANGEVYKRRFLNAMNQGASMKTNHMYHMVDEELGEIDPTLSTKYGKMMSAADYMYYISDNVDTTPAKTGGIVKLELPMVEGGKPKIIAKALVFPVLIHELVKGVMELLSSHGLPEDPKIREYVIGKADYVKAEPWDMRLGPALWGKLTKTIQPEDFHLKHHIYGDLAQLPVDEFNSTMREVMAGTNRGKQIINDMTENIKKELQEDDFNRGLDERRQDFEQTNNEFIDNPDDLDHLWDELGI